MIFLFLPLLLLSNSLAFAEQTSTTVSGNSRVSYQHIEDHPIRFNLETLTMCWGGQSSVEDKTSQPDNNDKIDKSSRDQGEFVQQAQIDGPLKTMILQKVKWESKFTDDYVFHVKILRETQDKINLHDHDNNNCIIHDFKYFVEKSTFNVLSSFKIAVPDNVYLVRLKTTNNLGATVVHGQFNAVINNVIEIPGNPTYQIKSDSDGAGKADAKTSGVKNVSVGQDMPGIPIKGEYEYFFTQPKDDIKIEIEFNDNTPNKSDWVSDIEVTFVGFNRCEQATKIALNNQSLSKETITKSLLDFTKDYNNKTIEQIHNELLFVSCLTQKASIEALLYKNNPQLIYDILQGVADFNQQVLQLEKSKAEKAKSEAAKNNDSKKPEEVQTVVQKMTDVFSNMSRYALSRSLLNQLKPLCTRYPTFDRDGREDGYITGYTYMYEKMNMISNMFLSASEDNNNFNKNSNYNELKATGLLDAKLSPSMGIIAQYYQFFVNQLKDYKTRHVDYNISDTDPDLTKIIDLGGYFGANDKSVLTNRALVEIQYFPPINPTEELVALFNSANGLHDKTLVAHALLFDIFMHFIHRSTKVMNLSRLEQEVIELNKFELAFYDAFKKVYAWVVGDASRNFTLNADNINVEHFKPTDYFLKTSYKKSDGSSVLEAFRKSFFDSSNDENLYNYFHECIRTGWKKNNSNNSNNTGNVKSIDKDNK